MLNSFLCTDSEKMYFFETFLLYWTVVTFHLAVQCTPLMHFQFCANGTERNIYCHTGTVISISEDSIRLGYKEHCGAKENSTHKQTGMTLLERCHGKEDCTLDESDIVESMCSVVVNALDFTYNCINLQGVIPLGGYSVDRKIGANKEIQVKSHNYPSPLPRKPSTYACEFTKIVGQQEKELFLRLQQVKLAVNSYLQIEIDDKRILSLIWKYDRNFVGQDNCKPLTFKEKIVVYYRKCATYEDDAMDEGSMWITMKTDAKLHVKCYTNRTKLDETKTTICSSEFRVDPCISKKLDISTDKDSICNSTSDAYPAPGSTDWTITIVIIVVLLMVLIVTVSTLVYFFILKPRRNGRRGPQNDTVDTDTAFSPMSTEPEEMNHYTEIDIRPSPNCTDIEKSAQEMDHYSDIDLRPSPNYTDIEKSALSHYTDIDHPGTVLERNLQHNATASVPDVMYGKVNKPKKDRAENGEGSKMLNDNNNVVDGLTEAVEDDTVMQENTDLYS